MFSGKNYKAKHSLSNRILFRFFILLSLTYIIFFIILFLVLKDFLAVKDRKMARAKHTQLETLLTDDDMVSISDFLGSGIQRDRFKDLLIKVVGQDNKTIYYQRPSYLLHFDKTKIDYEVNKKSNYSGHFKILSKDIGHETIEVFADKISGKMNLMVGVNTDESEDFLWSFLSTLFFIMIFMSFFTILISYYFLRKSLMPIRNLINTIKSVQNGHVSNLSSTTSSQDEIEELSNVFNVMAFHTNKLLESLQYSLDSIAHDLRTPISHIINRGQLAIKSQDSKIYKEALYYCIEELKDLSTLLSTIMDISENEAGSINLNITNFDLKKLFEECLEIFEYTSNEKKIDIVISDFEDTKISADRNKLKQVFTNLISNSIKYSDSHVKISISINKNLSYLIIRIQDNGWGISETDKTKIWERLYRGDKSRSSPGMGLGLTLVKSIIQRHKGEITLQSEVGVGSVFIITLPKS